MLILMVLYFNIGNSGIDLPGKALLDAFNIEVYSKFSELLVDYKMSYDDFNVLLIFI